MCQRGVGVNQVGGRIDGATGLARVAVLIFGMTFRALAFDVSVRQKHALDRIKKLLNLACFDQSSFAQFEVNTLGELDVFRRIRGVPVIELDMKALQILRALGCDTGHELLRSNALGLGFQHDGGAVRVVSPDKVHRVSCHPH